VGCGDSWYCGIATRLAFEAWSGVPAEALQALEFSRYYGAYAPKNSLLVAISNSGRVSRTVEAVIHARHQGMKTVAGTSALESRIAKEAETTLDLGYAERRFAPGTSSYMASMLIEYCIALYVAEVNGRMTVAQVNEKLDEISAQADEIQKTIDANKPILENLAAQVQLTDKFVFIGGGPNYGTAFFSMAKIFEAARANAAGQELEEWAHEQYFITDKSTCTFVIAPPGAGVDRAREQLWAANEMGSTTVAVCSQKDSETASLGKVHAPVFSGPDEALTPLTYCIPGELFAFFFAVQKNLTMLGFDDPHVKEVNFQQIFNSKIVEP
jgi:glucosamine--fructose-6-phosphate aminotransferase (isomerizing)